MRSLFQSIGLVKGDRIAILCRNYPEWIFTFWVSVHLIMR